MNRLTIWHDNGVRIRASANACSNECREEEAMHCFWCRAIGDIIQHLAEYEDSGLSPEEVAEVGNFMKSQLTKLLAENGKLKAELQSYDDGLDSADD